MEPIEPKDVRYIKLGAGGRWEQRALERGEVYFGISEPRNLIEAADWGALADHVRAAGQSRGMATYIARENREFGTLGSDCLWITFMDGYLWWGFADPEVIYLGGDGDLHGQRMRKIIGGWRNTDIHGKALAKTSLSSRLTQVAGYRHTMCSIKHVDYLIRKINGQQEEIVKRAARVRDDMIGVATDAIQMLHWADFENLVDLIFARTGWQRVSELGGTQKDLDLELEQPTTQERAFVQVKSRSDQATLEASIEAFTKGPWERMFFACHSPDSVLRVDDRRDVSLWTGHTLAAAAVRAGLYDWLMQKAG